MASTGRPSGRPAKPLEVKRALGNPGQRVLPDAPGLGEGLAGVDALPSVPVLGVDGEILWAHVWQAGKSWLSPDSDQTIITLLCQAQDEHEEIRRLLWSGEIERYYTTANGQMVTHPLVTQLANLRTQMTAWLAALGFSPADRSRLGLAEVRVRDEMDELMKRRNDRATG